MLINYFIIVRAQAGSSFVLLLGPSTNLRARATKNGGGEACARILEGKASRQDGGQLHVRAWPAGRRQMKEKAAQEKWDSAQRERQSLCHRHSTSALNFTFTTSFRTVHQPHQHFLDQEYNGTVMQVLVDSL